MDLNEEALKISIELFNHFNLTRRDISFIINTFRHFIKNTYKTCLLEQLKSSISMLLSDEIKTEINRIFTDFQDPFEKLRSEDVQFRLFSKLGLYLKPENQVIEAFQ